MGESDEMVAQLRRIEPARMGLEGANLARLKADHRRQEPVAIAEPLVEAFLGAVSGPRHARGRQRLLAAVDKQAQRAVQNGVLARRIIRLAGVDGDLHGGLLNLYRTVRYAAYAAKFFGRQAGL